MAVSNKCYQQLQQILRLWKDGKDYEIYQSMDERKSNNIKAEEQVTAPIHNEKNCSSTHH